MSDAVNDVLKKIADVAKLAGIRGRVDEERKAFIANFTLENKRTQGVMIRQTGQGPTGSPVVTFSSACVVKPSGWLRGLSRDQALDLLRANERIPFSRYSIISSKKEDMVLASMDALLETLDPVEFNTYIWAVARAADMYEAEHKQDQF